MLNQLYGSHVLSYVGPKTDACHNIITITCWPSPSNVKQNSYRANCRLPEGCGWPPVPGLDHGQLMTSGGHGPISLSNCKILIGVHSTMHPTCNYNVLILIDIRYIHMLMHDSNSEFLWSHNNNIITFWLWSSVVNFRSVWSTHMLKIGTENHYKGHS